MKRKQHEGIIVAHKKNDAHDATLVIPEFGCSFEVEPTFFTGIENDINVPVFGKVISTPLNFGIDRLKDIRLLQNMAYGPRSIQRSLQGIRVTRLAVCMPLKPWPYQPAQEGFPRIRGTIYTD